MNIYILNALMALFSVQILRAYLASFPKGTIRFKAGYSTVWAFYFCLQYFVISSGSVNQPLLIPLANILLMTLAQIFPAAP